MAVQSIIGTLGGSVGLLWLINWLLGIKKWVTVKDKVVLITGANSGLGKACALLFYKNGCNVILAGRNVQELTNVQNQLLELKKGRNSAAILQVDLSDLDRMESVAGEAVRLFGKVDILINNAGISYRGNIIGTDMAVHEKVMKVNYLGQIALTKGLLPYMIKAGGGHIVAISSVQGRVATPHRSAYTASKHALQAYFDTLRAEMSDKNIKVCVVSPGYIRTNLSLNALCGDGSKYDVMDPTTAGGKTPEYVAGVILQSVKKGKQEVVIAPLLHKFVILLRTFCPNLYFLIMAKRSQKEHVKAD